LNVMKPELMVMGRDGRPVQRARRRFSVRESNKQVRTNPDRRSKMISAPSNFNHISHMGPGDGIQIQRLMDLPTTLETADTVSNPIISSPLQAQQPNPPPGSVRVKSMIQQSPGGKLPSRLPSAHPAHPQRSISHNEAGMRSYFNGGGSTASSATPPPSLSGRTRGSTGQMIAARSSSASLPRSPESDIQAMIQAAGGSSGSGQGSLGSHGSTQEVYVNIYQNTNHPSLFESNAEGSPRHSLGSNNSSNFSSPPSPVREHGSSSYES